MPRFTRRRRSYLGCERVRVDFKITVKHISFSTNQYFLANSHYVLFRKENKSKKFQSKSKVPAAANLKKIIVNETIKFRACLVQDLAHKYLERYIFKERRFHIRQVTEKKNDEMYVDCGYFKLPLHEFAMRPSGQDIIVEFIDPQKMATGTVHLLIEHEPSVRMKFLPNVSAAFWRLFAKEHVKTPLPPSILEMNQDKLDFLKSKKQDHHHSQKYDESDDEDSACGEEETLSNSAEEDDVLQINDFNRSFLIASAEREQQERQQSSSQEGGALMTRQSMELGGLLFTAEDFDGTLSSCKENTSHRSTNPPINDASQQEQPPLTARSAGSGDFAYPEETPRSHDTASTITTSLKDGEADLSPPLPQFDQPSPPYQQRFIHSVESRDDSEGCNHVPFLLVGGGGNRTAAPPGALPSRSMNRSFSESAGDVKNKSFMTPPVPPLPMPSRQSAAVISSGVASVAAPAPVPPPPPPRFVPRMRSEPNASLARATLDMNSEDEREGGGGGGRQNINNNNNNNNYFKDTGNIHSSRPKKVAVPIRLVKGDDVNAVLAGLSPREDNHHHRVLHARPQSMGDMSHHRQQQVATAGPLPPYDSPSGVSVKDLRRNFERPPLVKDNSGSSYESNSSGKVGKTPFPSVPAVPAQLVPQMMSPPPPAFRESPQRPQPFITMKRSDSERSYSTISTHTNIPPAAVSSSHGTSGAKMLVPVRLSAQEEAYGRAAPLVPPPPPVPAPLHHSSHGHQSNHHLHRVATAPSMGVPVAGEKAPYQQLHLQQPQHQHQQDAYRGGGHGHQEAHQSHRMHRTATSPSMMTAPVLPVSGVKAPITGYDGQEDRRHHHHHQYQQQQAPHAHSPRSGAPIIAPPIRLQASDYAPPPYREKQPYRPSYPLQQWDFAHSSPREHSRERGQPPRMMRGTGGANGVYGDYYDAPSGVASRYNGVYAN